MIVDITNCYAGANVFITGATGFVGLCLIEKLLRCIPDIGNIYILIRSKKDENSCARYMDLLENHIFDKIKEEKGVALFRKIFPIPGDLSKENLDIHTENFNVLIEKVDFVFHCAANLDFMDNLKNAVNINLLGTRRIIELCKKLNHLKGLIHVSSAYVNSNRKFAEEVIYPLPNNTDSMIALLNNLDEEAIKTVTPVILEGHTNAYTFTKALAENEISSSNDLFPTAIVRPSMITGAWKEPIPGWTNSKNGPQGFFMAVSKGIVRRLPIDKHLIYDYIPVDVVVNEIISSGWYISQIKPPETLILHCTTSAYKPFTWSIVESEVKCLLNMYPVQSAIWYPTLKLIPSMSVFRISAFIFHMIPAYFLDIITRLNGRKPVLVKLHKNINKSLEQLSPFIFNEWKFDNTNSIKLHKSLTEKDQVVFGMDVKDLIWKSYFNDLVLGVRMFLNKESLNTIPLAKKKHKYLWLLNICVQIFVIHALCFLVCTCTGMSLLTGIWTVPIIVFFFNFF